MDDQLDDLARMALSFGSQAAAYDEYRPDYPVELFEWGLSSVPDADDLRVLDLAAGTGKLTRGLVALGVNVVAVEPDSAMLAQLTSNFPDVPAHIGTAEHIPLPDSSVHAVFVGQALHWFDLDLALPEIGRVLRPGGSLIAAWNGYDDREPWVADFVSIAEFIKRRDVPINEAFPLEPFGVVEEIELRHQKVRTIDSLVNVAATQSHMLVAAPEQRDAVLAELREFLTTDPATANGEFVVPMVTAAIKATPPGPGAPRGVLGPSAKRRR